MLTFLVCFCLALPNVAFFFSAISSTEARKSKHAKDEESDETDTEEEIISSFSQSLEAHSSLMKKRIRPAVTYWICLTTPNGAPANPLIVLRALLECQVEASTRQVRTIHCRIIRKKNIRKISLLINSSFVSLQVPLKEGVDSVAMKELYKLLKDHKNPFMHDLVTFSYQQCYRQEARDILDDSVSSSQAELECGTENVVRVQCIINSYAPLLSHALDKLMEAKLRIDILGISREDDIIPERDQHQPEKRLADKLTVLVNDIDIGMQKLGYALHRGKVYRRVSVARFTYSFKCEPREFVNTLARNEFYKARLLGNMKKIIDMMSDPYCEVISPLTINYNLIEVNHGMCWSVRDEKFIPCPIQDDDIGRISPRAFCLYDSTKAPDPRYFKEILENSLTDEEQGTTELIIIRDNLHE